MCQFKFQLFQFQFHSISCWFAEIHQMTFYYFSKQRIDLKSNISSANANLTLYLSIFPSTKLSKKNSPPLFQFINQRRAHFPSDCGHHRAQISWNITVEENSPKKAFQRLLSLELNGVFPAKRSNFPKPVSLEKLIDGINYLARAYSI